MLILLLVPLSSKGAYAFFGWSSTVVDSITGKPIEGAVVVRSWDRIITGPPDGSHSSFLTNEEVLTDEDGSFRIRKKSFHISISLFGLQLYAVSENPPIIYKPGYKFLSLREKPQRIQLERVATE